MKPLDRLCAALAVLSGAVLLCLIALTFVDVVMRYLLSAPILGSKDLLEMGMVLVFAFALPFTWRMGGHIVVDLVPDYPLRGLTSARDVAVRSIGVFVFAVLAWQGWVRAEDAALFNEATNMIEIPFRPFFLALAGASAIQALVLCIETARLIAGRPVAPEIAWLRPAG